MEYIIREHYASTILRDLYPNFNSTHKIRYLCAKSTLNKDAERIKVIQALVTLNIQKSKLTRCRVKPLKNNFCLQIVDIEKLYSLFL